MKEKLIRVYQKNTRSYASDDWKNLINFRLTVCFKFILLNLVCLETNKGIQFSQPNHYMNGFWYRSEIANLRKTFYLNLSQHLS
jgi:hypothetical protein